MCDSTAYARGRNSYALPRHTKINMFRQSVLQRYYCSLADRSSVSKFLGDLIVLHRYYVAMVEVNYSLFENVLIVGISLFW